MSAFVSEHPFVQHKLSILRNEKTDYKQFKELISEIATILCYEATKDYPVVDKEVQTPLEKTVCKTIFGNEPVVIPILRAGLGMVDGVLNLMPSAKVGHIGLYRDERTLKPVEYFCRLPKDIDNRNIFLVDPMLATGGSAVDAVTLIKQRNPKSIKFLCILAAPIGLETFQKAHPDVDVYCACVDRELNEKGYILPGLGDAGDRIFGTI